MQDAALSTISAHGRALKLGIGNHPGGGEEGLSTISAHGRALKPDQDQGMVLVPILPFNNFGSR